MKQMIKLALALAVGLSISGVLAAQGDNGNPDSRAPANERYGARTGSQSAWGGQQFIDENGDGICDYAEQGRAMMGRGNRHGADHGPNFVDEDGDGNCDNAGSGMRRGGRNTRGHGRHGR